jgi:hypothetical protein
MEESIHLIIQYVVEVAFPFWQNQLAAASAKGNNVSSLNIKVRS